MIQNEIAKLFMTPEQRAALEAKRQQMATIGQETRGPAVDAGPTPQEEWDAQWQATPMKQFMDETQGQPDPIGPSDWLSREKIAGRVPQKPLASGSGTGRTPSQNQVYLDVRNRNEAVADARMEANKAGLADREAQRANAYYQGNYASPFGAGNVNNPAPFNPIQGMAGGGQQAGLGGGTMLRQLFAKWFGGRQGPQGFMRPMNGGEQIAQNRIDASERMNRDDNQTKLAAAGMRPQGIDAVSRIQSSKLERQVASLQKERMMIADRLRENKLDLDRRDKDVAGDAWWDATFASTRADTDKTGKKVSGSYEALKAAIAEDEKYLKEIEDDIAEAEAERNDILKLYQGAQ